MRLAQLSFAVFVVGGLLFGMLGISNLSTLARTTWVPRPDASNTPTSASFPPLVTLSQNAAAQDQTGPVGLPLPATLKAAAASAKSFVDPWRVLYVQGGDLWETNGGSGIRLTQVGAIEQPALGPDALAFVERGRNASDVWLASADGSPHPVTQDGSPIVPQNHWVSQPVFITSQRRLLVLGDFDKSSTGPGDLAVWQLNLQSGGVLQITHPTAYTGGDQDVSVSPIDSHQIIFTRYSYAGTQLVEQVEWVDVSTEAAAVPLTPSDRRSRQATFSPDGTEVAFIQHGIESNEDLFNAMLQVDGRQAHLENVQPVATGVIANPVWSPDGTRLAYIALTRDGFQVESLDIQQHEDGTQTFGEPRQLTAGRGVDPTSRPVYMTQEQADRVQQWLAQMPAANG